MPLGSHTSYFSTTQSFGNSEDMEKATGLESVEKEQLGSSLEQESEPVKTVAEKEIAVQNVEYADAVKDLSPWVSIGIRCIGRLLY